MAHPIIRTRRVFHVPGYDPAPAPAVKHRFARELKRFEQCWSVRAALAEGGDDERWRVDTSGPNWRTETYYHLVRWDDLIAEAGRGPHWRRIPQGLFAFFDFAISALPRYVRENWRYALFFLYPFLMLTLLAALAIFAGRFTAHMTGYPLAGIAAAILALLLLWQWPGRRIYLHLLFDDWIFSRRYARHGDEVLDGRLQGMARELVEAANAADVDEIAVIGHSLGAVLAIDLLDRALKLNPDLGQSGARVVFLSVGSSILKIGLHSAATRFRASVERVASAPGIFWGDYQAIADVMNFYKRDPLTAMGLAARDAPLVRMVRIRHMLDPAVYKRIKRRFLRMHLQFVSGNNLRNAYDYFMLICGPLSIETQVRDDGALSAIGPDGGLIEKSGAAA